MDYYQSAKKVKEFADKQTFPNHEIDRELFILTTGALAVTNPNETNEFSINDVITFYNLIINQEALTKVMFFRGEIRFNLDDLSMEVFDKEERERVFDKINEITLKFTGRE